MTKDDIIELAREAGLLSEDEAWVSLHQEAMERFAELLEAKVRADDRKLLEQALKALEVLTDTYDDNAVGIEIDAIVALRKRLAQPETLQRLTDVQQEIEAALAPEQKPVAWMYSEGLAALKAGKCWTAYGTKQDKDNNIPLYTAPQKREWQGLTDEEISEINKSIPSGTEVNLAKRVFAREIEAKLKEKNT